MSLPRGIAAAIASELAGAIVQRVHAGRALVALELRLPGRSELLGFSLLRGAAGPLLLGDAELGEASRELVSFRDHLRSVLTGTRLLWVREGALLALGLAPLGGAPQDERVLLLLVEGRGGANLALVNANLALVSGGATHALRRPSRGDDLAIPAPGPEAPAIDLRAWSADLLARRRAVAARESLLDTHARARAALQAARRLVGNRQDDVARLGDPARARERADALAAVLHEVRRGQESVVLTLADGTREETALDPRHGPGESLRRAYAKAARAERGLSEARRLLDAAREKAVALEGIVSRGAELLAAVGDELPAPDDVAAIAALTKEAHALLPTRRLRAVAAAPARAGRTLPEGVREFTSRDGLRILAGRSATSNDALTFGVARGNDAWLHAKDVGGPHVVLVVPKGVEIPQESLIDAATVAHALGKLGTEPRGEVVWTRAKHVRRVKGAPGRVTITQERVISLKVERERVARLRLRGPAAG